MQKNSGSTERSIDWQTKHSNGSTPKHSNTMLLRLVTSTENDSVLIADVDRLLLVIHPSD